MHNLTTVDAPETVRYVKSKSEVLIEYPKMTMWQLIVKHKTPPTRRFRYCCEELKERSGVGKKLITGVRKAESRKRAQNQGIVTFTKPNKEIKKRADDENFQSTAAGGVVVLNYENAETRRMVESCYRTSKTLVNPIINWDNDYLWWYIRHEGIEINPLYNGGCPGGCTVMSGTVTSSSPLKIKIEQRFEISGSMLILPEHLKEREIKVTVKPTHTEDGGTPEHNHEYGGELTVTVHSGLSVGDSVQVVRQQGGQKYLVIGKVV